MKKDSAEANYNYFTTNELSTIYKLIKWANVTNKQEPLLWMILYKIELWVRYDLSYYTPYDHKKWINYDL